MDLKGSLVDTHVKVYPSVKLVNFLQSLPSEECVPNNVQKFAKHCKEEKSETKLLNFKEVQLNKQDINNIEKYKHAITKKKNIDNDNKTVENDDPKNVDKCNDTNANKLKNDSDTKFSEEYLNTVDIDWLYAYLKKKRSENKETIPYLHDLLEGSKIDMPNNETIKRNPLLEARCVKLRAQQEAREYRKMTKGVDNVRMRFPEDSISYQLKSMNRQLIAIGQFIISIFAGFLFGFRGVEWMVGNLDFGFRLLLGVMCALVIALAEIYFLAKKLNEELNVPETVQLGGPPKFADEPKSSSLVSKEHQD